MPPWAYSHAGLGVVIENFMGPLEAELLEEELPGGTTRILANWYRLTYCLLDEEHRHELRAIMSTDQKRSYCLLWEWWTAAYQDPGTSLTEILNIASSSRDLDPKNENKDSWKAVLSHLELRHWPEGEISVLRPSAPGSTGYHEALSSLFKAEFAVWMGDYERDATIGSLKHARRNANVSAYCQQMAMCCFRTLSNKIVHNESAETRHWKSLAFNDLLHEIMDFPHQGLECGPMLEICSWLQQDIGTKPDSTSLPYYLWDRCTKSTIQTANLKESPSYIAISHTWGRWKKTNQPSIKIDGVPWLVPQNTRFEVSSLPNILDNADWGTRYLWFDLLCIPQDRSQIAIREIARQAEIFRGAKHAVAWFNDVNSFRGLDAIIKWYALQLLLFPEGSNDYISKSQLIDEALAKIAGQPSGLFEPRTGLLNRMNFRPNAWFTSLWTLQEICLRPDMWLCNADWNPVTINGKIPLPVNGLIVIRAAVQRQVPQFSRLIPPLDSLDQEFVGLSEVEHWALATGLDKLLELTRADILALGDRRHCTSRRAEAIMSILGATTWYSNMNAGEREANLVLGKYPLPFVQEIQSLIPGEFFTSYVKARIAEFDERGEAVDNGSDDEDPLEDVGFQEGMQTDNWHGSLLPFSCKGMTYIKVCVFGTRDFVSHKTISEWIINTQGNVYMKHACVIGSSGHFNWTNESGLRCTILGLDFRDAENGTAEGERREKDENGFNIDLKTWIQSRKFIVHAVVLMYRRYTYYEAPMNVRHLLPEEDVNVSTVQIYGVLLQELKPGILVKIANFVVSDINGKTKIPETSNVSWMVL
ncbi:hypothetical protein BP6252_14096 [Coleophoma cylindrospora]|uniref:Heterokaryon incompatibility domain-containing protein n=1 Tax=Coleophoma cylindrospora TaxID=1849047 RepID=A0A3D8Q4L6_9HELO|nr:hypothetical protein BP6252_14096 [Coleophoma cylindrospora]